VTKMGGGVGDAALFLYLEQIELRDFSELRPSHQLLAVSKKEERPIY
jgi:hypothetical protein